MLKMIALALGLASGQLVRASDPDYDHQSKAYTPSHEPATVASGDLTLEGFFSPDSSTSTYVRLLDEAAAGSTVDIYTPSFGSWDGCTWDDDGCIGCTIEETRKESFPVFPAILNAVHERGVKVRIISNDYHDTTCPGMVSPYDFLVLNGVEVRWYASTTFMHSKVVIVTPKEGATANTARLAISSINWSKTSMTKNREAGVLLRGGREAAVLFGMVQSVFDDDWQTGVDYEVGQTYSKADLAAIRDPATIPITLPTIDIPGHFVAPSPAPLQAGSTNMTVYTSPDFARDQLFADINATQSSLQLFIYQVTDEGLCDALIDLIDSGKNVSLLVSHDIYGSADRYDAKNCYKKINDLTGYVPRMTEEDLKYSHQKYWIVDGSILGLSTGNWSPTDYAPVKADAHGTYPQYGKAGWQRVNRDFNVRVQRNAALLKLFNSVFDADFARGHDWTSSW